MEVAVVLLMLISAQLTAANWIEPMTGLRFVRIPAGSFLMGDPENDKALHEVKITHDFYLSATEVTQGQWTRIMGHNPSHFQKCGSDCPVETVSYYDIRKFIAKLNERNEGFTFRLPSEAEWEYACRAGTQTETITTDQANFDGKQPKPVGSFPPNAWGLFDMQGNVWEWCEDWYKPYASDAIDPKGPVSGKLKVIRGGSWYFGADSARCGLRYTHRPVDSGFSLGFRLVVVR